ncbi:MAG: NAD(P)H-binding protein [Syntrophobacteraceae bacterium]
MRTTRDRGKIVVTGATGFVGGRLVRALSERGIELRCIVRSEERFRELFPDEIYAEPVEADMLKPRTLDRALKGVELAFYLVHSMGGQTIFENRIFAERDREAARNFVQAADRAGVRRIIYLGGLGEMGDDLSKHLASRREVAEILRSGRVSETILRAANIIGAGGAPFEMLRHIVERLPVIFAPRWIDTRCQPIDIHDVVAYLIGSMENPDTAGAEFDIGGPDIITYREMMEIYARVRGLKRLIIAGPYSTPRLSAIFISLITPVPSGVTNPLLEGLRNEVICRENRIRELIPIALTPLEYSICNALYEEQGGPGKVPSRQACFLKGRY